jgi:predicted amidohydrolase
MTRLPLTIAVYQCAPQPLDVAANLQRLRDAAQRARAQGAQLLVCPEMFLTGYAIGAAAVQALARSADPAREGSYASTVAQIARQTAMDIVYGYPERGDDGAAYNAAQWMSAQGQVRLNYRKSHLYGELDAQQFSPAPASAALAELRGWQIGLMICYDVEFPEAPRFAALAGADVLLVPTANMEPNDFVPQRLVPVRAFENQIALAYANFAGTESSLIYNGQSLICGADGIVLSQSGRSPDLLVATLQPEALELARRQQTHLQDLRAWQRLNCVGVPCTDE